MMQRFLLVSCLWTLLFGTSYADDPKELAKLDGTWTLV